MKRPHPLCTLALTLATFLVAPSSHGEDLAYYLSADVEYDPTVPVPSSVLGYEVGEWHVRHDQLVAYMTRLAEQSDRVLIEEIGRTHEQRPLIHLTISTPENLGRLERIRQAHLELSDPQNELPNLDSMPVIVNLSYSVHGNEASGSNAALLAAYHLAAARGEAIEELLSHAVILLDPCLNPDGLARFAGWANMHRGRVLVADPEHREHREGWPNGRTNHYWFDLNRDWLLAQHPESRARLKQFQRWRPNVLIDAHEMGSRSTYFFQPGVPQRKNPLTPEQNVALTAEFAKYHARILDDIGSLYYTEETFDDFYYGKGSTYPDIHGAVGILFEQASVRGHRQQTPNGELTFPFAIRNQLRTTLSTLQASLDKRRELLTYQHEFYRSASQQAEQSELSGYVVGDSGDPARAHHLLEILLLHQLETYSLTEPLQLNGESYLPGQAFFVPIRQPQHLLVRSLFEKQVEFADSTFYDVSTWNLPLAFNLPFTGIEVRSPAPRLGARLTETKIPIGAAPSSDGGVALAFAWDATYAPRALQRFLAGKTRARVATKAFQAQTGNGLTHFDVGTIVIPFGIQDPPREDLMQIASEVAVNDGIEIYEIASGLTPSGADLGSPSHKPIAEPSIALVVGGDVATYAAGEIWHLLDRRQEIPVSLIDQSRLTTLDLSNYTHLILADGRYRRMPSGLGETIHRWVRNGGVLIALQRATRWVDHRVVETASSAEAESSNGSIADASVSSERRPYAQHETERAAQLISGAIFEVDLDITHPLAYGYRTPRLPVFRNHETFLPPEPDPYATVAAYTEEPLLSGYVSPENLSRLRGSTALTAKRQGRGTIIRMVDNPSFRAYWYGTEKLLLNAIFFGRAIEPTERSLRQSQHED